MDIHSLGFLSAPAGAVDSFSGRLIICASGRCLWDDLERVSKRFDGEVHDVMAVKQVGIHFPWPIRHWVGAHGERFQWMVPLRKDGYYFRGKVGEVRGVHPVKQGFNVHSDRPWPMVDKVWEVRKLTGTSTLFGVKVAMALGYDEIVLCGAPLDGSGRYYSAPSKPGDDLNMATMQEWDEYYHLMKGRVKSMSGRTRELLGEP